VETEERKEQADGGLCQACGKGYIDRSESAHSIMCTECRDKMIRHPVPKIFLLFSLLVFVLVVVAFYHFPEVLDSYKIYERSPALADSGEITIALTELNTLIEKYPNSNPIAVRMADIAMEKGYYEYAGYVIDTYLYGEEMNDVLVDRMNGYVDRINQYYTTYNAVSEFQSTLDPALPLEEVLSQCYDFVKELMHHPMQDKALLYYYLSMFTTDITDMKSSLESCLAADCTFLDAKVQLGNLARRQEEPAAAEKYYNEVLAEDKYHSGALRGLAILRLLDGNPAEGLDLARQAFENNPEEPYVWETYIIALSENNMDDEAKAQLDAYQAQGELLGEDTQAYLDGTLSLHDYYVGE
jgi:tetratricopeptide (TPR) repeat protein